MRCPTPKLLFLSSNTHFITSLSTPKKKKKTDIVCFCIMTPHNLVLGTGVEEHTSTAGGLLKIHIVCSPEALITIYHTAILNIHHCENMN